MLEGHVKKKPKVKKSKFEDMQDKGRWSGKILERSRRTISRMLCKRHRKSFYCRHRQQLWGNKKKKKFTSVTLSHSKVHVMFCHFPVLLCCGRNSEEISQHLLFKNRCSRIKRTVPECEGALTEVWADIWGLRSEDVWRWLWGDTWMEHLLLTEWDDMFLTKEVKSNTKKSKTFLLDI